MPPRVVVTDAQSDRPVEAARWGALAEAVLTAEGVDGEAELSLSFVDEATIAELNERWLGHDGPTDVLSFPIDDDPDDRRTGDPDAGGAPPVLLGDVVVCPAVAFRNAPDHAGTYDDELALLVVHGVLHVLGMDHEDPDEADAMEAREQALLEAHHRSAP
ncbi:MAG: rRNA maturation RNase YbeY [Actinomycetota bacterium]|nr:rRNA maturation RNase YbeY [Actinomycetota bacterium]